MPLKLNIACGPDVKQGWINIDKYPQEGAQYGNICQLDYESNTVDYVLCNYVFEHLTFLEEREAFEEATRVLKPGGMLEVKVPDFELTVKQWLEAKDDWKCFYKLCDPSDPEYGFGHGQDTNHRWGTLLTHIFGSHSAPGLVHINAFTEAKLQAIFEHLNYDGISIDRVVESDRGYDITALIAVGVKC